MAPRPSAGALSAAGRSFTKNTAAPSISQRADAANVIGTFMLPGTMVPPPILRSLREAPADAVRLQWARVKTRVIDAIRIVGVWFTSKPGFLKGARLRLNRASLVPTAKALHRTMSEALAAGDRDTLRRVCVPVLYENLSARLARRPNGHRYEWSLERYTNQLRYPRIVDHKLAALPTGSGQLTLMHQVVVAISSRQRLVRRDDKNGGAPVTGSEKVVDLVENLVLIRPVDMATYKGGDWAVFGHAEETTYRSWAAESRALDVLSQQP